MKLGLMQGDLLPPAQLRAEGFEAVQMFFGAGLDGGPDDPAPAEVDQVLEAAQVSLAAMTLHAGLVGPRGEVREEVTRLVRCLGKTAVLAGRFGDNPQPVLVWHPSEYPEEGVDDGALFEGLCQGLARACAAAETAGVSLAVEITRGGTIDGAERFLRVLDKVGSAALKVCMDAANFAPDRTPLVRAVRTLGPHIAIAHGKDARFGDSGEVADYGPAGSGHLDYPAYIGALREYAPAPYFVLEYYSTREELMRARDLVQSCL